MYLQTCLQLLVEVRTRARAQDHLCGEHRTVNHSTTPATAEDLPPLCPSQSWCRSTYWEKMHKELLAEVDTWRSTCAESCRDFLFHGNVFSFYICNKISFLATLNLDMLDKIWRGQPKQQATGLLLTTHEVRGKVKF